MIIGGWGNRARSSLTAALLTCGLLVSACSGEPQPTPSPSPTSVAGPTDSTPELEDSPSPTDTASETETSEAEATEPTDDATPKPPVLDKQASGRDLTTADFFAYPKGWRDGRFNVAGKQSVPGVAGPLEECADDADEDTSTVELRLANNFSKISMKVAQSDDSPSSDVVVTLKLFGNGKYIDTVNVPFNKIVDFDANVSNVNALQMQVWVGGIKCDYNSKVDVVLTDLRVE